MKTPGQIKALQQLAHVNWLFIFIVLTMLSFGIRKLMIIKANYTKIHAQLDRIEHKLTEVKEKLWK